MEIERKFLIQELPDDLERFPHAEIIQAYLNTEPVLRIRKYGDDYIFTYKGSGLMVREEYNLPLTKEAFEHLLPKADGNIIQKVRYRIPLTGNADSMQLVGELDVFTEPKPLVMIEVEFPDEESALSFTPPDWFGAEVTQDPAYHNSRMV